MNEKFYKQVTIIVKKKCKNYQIFLSRQYLLIIHYKFDGIYIFSFKFSYFLTICIPFEEFLSVCKSTDSPPL